MVVRTLLISLAGMALFAATAYQTEISEWRKARETALRADGGWLTVTGLFWLREGRNTYGTDKSNDIVLPDGPARGVLTLAGGKVNADGLKAPLRPDTSDALTAGRLKLYLIKRGERYGIRLKDPQSEYRRNFHGIDNYPANEAYRITAKFVAEARKLPILNVLGQTEQMESPGYAVFRLAGREVKLYPVLEEPGAKQLFYIFRDQTSGKETYGAGRFLYSDLPRDGSVVLDFNKAYNPPCAFTPFATCPLPPKENRLPVAIPAGEKKYGH